MTDKTDCERAREAAAEVALGVLSGDDRADVLEHIARCPECRDMVVALAGIGDRLLTLAPSREPPLGFESRVMAALKGDRRSGRRRWVTAVAAAVVAAAVAASGVMVATRDDRDLAARYRDALARANGEYFAVWDLRADEGGKAGNVFGYEGHPSWVFIDFSGAAPGEYVVSVTTSSGETIPLGSFELTEAKRSWGTELAMELQAIEELRVAREGEIAYTSSFGPARRE